jgi:hypothetical protein
MKEIDIKDISNKDIYEILKNLNLPNAYIAFQNGDGCPSCNGFDIAQSIQEDRNYLTFDNSYMDDYTGDDSIYENLSITTVSDVIRKLEQTEFKKRIHCGCCEAETIYVCESKKDLAKINKIWYGFYDTDILRLIKKSLPIVVFRDI